MTDPPKEIRGIRAEGLLEALLEALLGRRVDEMDAAATEIALDRGAELGIFPWLYDRLIFAGLPATSHHRARWRAHLLRLQIHRHEAARALEAVGRAGLEVRVMKGWWLGEEIFGDPRRRDTSDVDLLVHPSEVEATVDALRPLGYQPPAGLRPQPWSNNQFAVYHRAHGLPIEIHWDVAHPGVPAPPVDWWFQGGEDGEAPRLSLERSFLHLCYHHHHHTGFLKGVVDLAAWIGTRGDRLDLDLIQEIAARHAIGGLIAWPMRTIEQLVGRPMPLSRLGGPLPRAWGAWNASAAHRVLRRPEVIAGWDRLAFKTQDILLGHQMVWDVMGASVLDTPRARLRSRLNRVFLGPQALAMAGGRERAAPGDYVNVALRPLTLVRKQVRQLLIVNKIEAEDPGAGSRLT